MVQHQNPSLKASHNPFFRNGKWVKSLIDERIQIDIPVILGLRDAQFQSTTEVLKPDLFNAFLIVLFIYTYI